MNMAIDVRDVLPVVSAPTLGVHQRADPWVAVEHGRYLAQHIPGAAYVELDDDGGHLPSAAQVPGLLTHVMPFLQEAVTREAPEPGKVLATILFSDIVGSTARAAELGDTRWRELLAGHHGRVRRACGSCGPTRRVTLVAARLRRRGVGLHRSADPGREDEPVLFPESEPAGQIAYDRNTAVQQRSADRAAEGTSDVNERIHQLHRQQRGQERLQPLG
jgi:hypothetical protein